MAQDKIAPQGEGNGFQMNYAKGLIFMLISATGMGLVPLFSRWATRVNMFDGTEGLAAGDSIGALMACGRMGMGVLFFVILLFATKKVQTFKELKLTPAIALGGLMIGMSLACYVTSTLLTTVANAVMFIYTGPVICVLCARIFRKEPMSALQWVCLLIVFVGMLFGAGRDVCGRLIVDGIRPRLQPRDLDARVPAEGCGRRLRSSVRSVLRPVHVLQRLSQGCRHHRPRRVELHLCCAGRGYHHHHPELAG